MAYEKRTWVPGVTKCSAENFNHMEDGIETAQKGVDELNTNMKVLNPSSLQIQSAADGTSTRITLFIYENAGFIEFKTPNGIQKRISLSDRELAIQKYQNGNLIANKVISTF